MILFIAFYALFSINIGVIAVRNSLRVEKPQTYEFGRADTERAGASESMMRPPFIFLLRLAASY